MKYLYPVFFLILLLSFSCGKNKKTQANEETIDSLILNYDKINNTLGETLSLVARKELETWGEYEDVDEFIISYYNISVHEALLSADELSNLVQLMKDSIRVEKLEKPNIIARLNVLHNETLRLKDMASIPTISDEEVIAEVTQILTVYDAFNSKINTIYKAEELQKELDVDTETPIDLEEAPSQITISKNRKINKNLKKGKN